VEDSVGRQLPASREHQISDLLREKRILKVAELSNLLGVSEATLRRDLRRMAAEGMIRRVRGGAELCELEGRETEGAFRRQLRERGEEKLRIGRVAAGLVRDGDVLLIDGGTTTYQAARELCGKHVRVITSSVFIAAALAEYPTVEILMPGGMVHGPYGDLIGPQVAEFLSRVRGQKLFTGADGLDASGLYCRNPLIAETDRLMIGAAQDEVIVVADHTKMGRAGVVRLADVSRITRVITGREALREHLDFLRDAGVEVLLA